MIGWPLAFFYREPLGVVDLGSNCRNQNQSDLVSLHVQALFALQNNFLV